MENRDNNCEFKDLCKETYEELFEEKIECKGVENCEHYDAFYDGWCRAMES